MAYLYCEIKYDSSIWPYQTDSVAICMAVRNVY